MVIVKDCTEMKISLSDNAIRDLRFHCSRLHCVVPNTMNFFNEKFISRIKFVLSVADNICNKEYFSLANEDADRLSKDVLKLRSSILSCGDSIRTTFYESFDFVFNVLIRMLNKRKFIIDNFSLESTHKEKEEIYIFS